MAAAVGLNQTAVSRIWRAFSLQPHRVEHWKLSKADAVRHAGPGHRAIEFKKFLVKIDGEVPAELDVHQISTPSREYCNVINGSGR
ncbi:MAG: hypothetical protein QOI84_1838 [Solirubrobacterales bacterium]|jgi:hypothetical protein|nr:hypothetical protein [Solirubrobacterales bacterium]